MAHIEASKLTAFLLHEQKLTEQEDGHLLHCLDCMHSMVDASGEELETQSHSETQRRLDNKERTE